MLSLLAGCVRSTPVQYYHLSALAAQEERSQLAAPKSATIGLGPVQLPEYLDRPQIVSRTSANRLLLADRHRWAEALTENMARTLSEDLAWLLDTDRIILHPWPRTRDIDCQITIQVLQFEGGPDGAAHLTARWTVLGKDGQSLLAERRSKVTVQATPQDQEGMVIALSQSVLRLAREIAAELPPLLTPGS